MERHQQTKTENFLLRSLSNSQDSSLSLSICFDDVFPIGLCFISAAACCFCLCHLWCKLPATMRRRLFWLQLCTLVSTDFLYCLFRMGFILLSITNFRSGQYVRWSIDECKGYLSTVIFLQLSSCLLELHVAMGFAAACFGLKRTICVLYYSIFLVFLISFGLLWAAEASLDIERFSESGQCHSKPDSTFGLCLLCSCGATVVLYMMSILRLAKGPKLLRTRAAFRSLWYIANFLVSFGPRAIFDVVSGPNHKGLVFLLTLDFLCLNGAMNVVTYFSLFRQSTARETLLQPRSVSTALNESRSPLDTSASAVDNWGIDHHFDFGLFLDDTGEDLLGAASGSPNPRRSLDGSDDLTNLTPESTGSGTETTSTDRNSVRRSEIGRSDGSEAVAQDPQQKVHCYPESALS